MCSQADYVKEYPKEREPLVHVWRHTHRAAPQSNTGALIHAILRVDQG